VRGKQENFIYLV